MNEKKGKQAHPFRHTLRVRYAEVDPQGIVFNAHYLNYLDVAIGEYFRARGLPYQDFVKKHATDFHVIRSVIDYRYGARYDDELEIFLRGECRGSKVHWFFELYVADTLICSGELVYIAVDAASRKVTPLRPELAGLLGLEVID